MHKITLLFDNTPIDEKYFEDIMYPEIEELFPWTNNEMFKDMKSRFTIKAILVPDDDLIVQLIKLND